MNRRLVVPGELVAEGNFKLGDGVYRDGDKIYSSVLGLAEQSQGKVRVIPLSGRYYPKVGDYVIAKVVGAILPAAWRLDIYAAYDAILNASDYYREIDPFSVPILKIMRPGRMVYALIREITPQRQVYITLRTRGTRVLKEGRLIEISPAKVPRVIGKKRSMINMIKELTQCDILVGQNGLVWVKGRLEDVELVERVLRKIEKEAHTSGLTDRIKEYIERERK